MEYFELLVPVNTEYILIDNVGANFKEFKDIVEQRYKESKRQRGGTPMSDMLKMFLSLFFKQEMSGTVANLGELPTVSGWIFQHLFGIDPNPELSKELTETFINNIAHTFDENVLYEIFMYFIQTINAVPNSEPVPSITSHLAVDGEWMYINPLVRVLKYNYKLAVLKHINPDLIRPTDQSMVKQALDKLKYTDDRVFTEGTSIFDIKNLDNTCNLVLEIIKKLEKETLVANNEFRLSFEHTYTDSDFATMPVDMYNYYIIIKSNKIKLKIVNYSDHFDYSDEGAYIPEYRAFKSYLSQPDIFFDMEVSIDVSSFNIKSFKTLTTELLTKFVNRLAAIFDADVKEYDASVSDFRNIILNYFGFPRNQVVTTSYTRHTPVLKFIQAIKDIEGNDRSKMRALENLNRSNPFTFQKMRIYFKDLPNDGKDVLERMFPPLQIPHVGGKWKSTGRKITCPDGKERILYKNKKESSVRVILIKNGKRSFKHRLLLQTS